MTENLDMDTYTPQQIIRFLLKVTPVWTEDDCEHERTCRYCSHPFVVTPNAIDSHDPGCLIARALRSAGRAYDIGWP